MKKLTIISILILAAWAYFSYQDHDNIDLDVIKDNGGAPKILFSIKGGSVTTQSQHFKINQPEVLQPDKTKSMTVGGYRISIDDHGNYSLSMIFQRGSSVESNCVDLALDVLTIMERHDSLDDVFVAYGDGGEQNHVQVVKRIKGELIYLCKTDTFHVGTCDSQFVNNELMLSSPSDFRRVAMASEHVFPRMVKPYSKQWRAQ